MAVRPFVIALAGIVLHGIMGLGVQPPMRGMMGESGDLTEFPVAMGQPEYPLCPGYILASNTLDQTDHGALEGYFAVGQGFDGVMRPNIPAYNYIKEFRGQNVDIVLRVRAPRKLEKIK